MITRNSDVFTVHIQDGFHVAVNPLMPGGYKVINRLQHRVLETCDGMTIPEIAADNRIKEVDAETIIRLVSSKQLVSTGEPFTQPQFSLEPKSLSIWVHLTNTCPLRCTYCHVWKDPTHMSVDVLERFADKLVQTAAEKGLKEITIRLSGGEPMTRLSQIKVWLLKLRERLHAVNCHLKISFLTNLTILNDEIIAFIKDNDCGLSVSMDGLGKYHDQNRPFASGRGSFATIDQNLDVLARAGIKPFIMTVIAEANMDDMPSFTEYLLQRDLGFKYDFVRRQVVQLDNDQLIKVMLECYALIEKAIESGYQFIDKHRLSGLSFKRPVDQSCGAGRNTFSVFVDGSLYVCQHLHEERNPFGDLSLDEDMVTLSVNQESLTGLRQLNHDDCRECRYHYNCAGGCPINQVDGKSPYCKVFQALIPEVYRLMGKERLLNVLNK